MPPASPNLAAVVVAETNILVVEDQRAVAGALRMRLRGLGISVNKARTHLKHIFHKTGAKRQSELIHQVETGPATMPL